MDKCCEICLCCKTDSFEKRKKKIIHTSCFQLHTGGRIFDNPYDAIGVAGGAWPDGVGCGMPWARWQYLRYWRVHVPVLFGFELDRYGVGQVGGAD
ncbi:hypothetical protein L2E82_32421 [Cichorium intybus]|uniref:Uncharacterized protein n=1 Tax=Cichorium intybus TaxID=13427 RepID=A0ACB9BHX9_CICIN|nr:hypothetical protein L2E82_32421 [Cichorium intybus]